MLKLPEDFLTVAEIRAGADPEDLKAAQLVLYEMVREALTLVPPVQSSISSEETEQSSANLKVLSSAADKILALDEKLVGDGLPPGKD